jgi:transcription elongation factor SPT4
MPGKKKNLSEEELKRLEDEDNFDEGDISDDSESRRRRRKRRQNEGEKRKLLISDQFMPNSLKKLRACVFCKIVLNQERWNKLEFCPNCPDSRGVEDTTDCFASVISLILPKKSWVAEWQRMQNLIPGLYAMDISNPSAIKDDFIEDEWDEEVL